MPLLSYSAAQGSTTQFTYLRSKWLKASLTSEMLFCDFEIMSVRWIIGKKFSGINLLSPSFILKPLQ